MKDYPGAIAELQKGEQADPFVITLLAEAYEKSGDTLKAVERQQRVLASTAHTQGYAFARPVAKRKLGSGG